MITYEKVWSNRSLVLHYTAKTAKEYATMKRKLHEHSEYDTEWTNKIRDWVDAGYFKNVIDEEFLGHSDCIFRITFYEVKLSKEFLIDLDGYLSETSYEKISCVTRMDREFLLND